MHMRHYNRETHTYANADDRSDPRQSSMFEEFPEIDPDNNPTIRDRTE